jgi:hypothetical protein
VLNCSALCCTSLGPEAVEVAHLLEQVLELLLVRVAVGVALQARDEGDSHLDVLGTEVHDLRDLEGVEEVARGGLERSGVSWCRRAAFLLDSLPHRLRNTRLDVVKLLDILDRLLVHAAVSSFS